MRNEVQSMSCSVYTWCIACRDESGEDIDENKGEKIKESTAKTLRALVAILKRLLQSATTDKVFTKEDVIKTAFKGTTLSCEEATAAGDIANFLNPFVPKNTAPQDITMFDGIAIATIADVVVRLVQPQQNQWNSSPKSSQQHLVLCHRKPYPHHNPKFIPILVLLLYPDYHIEKTIKAISYKKKGEGCKLCIANKETK